MAYTCDWRPSAPELDSVEHQQIGDTAYGISRRYHDEHKLVQELIAYALVPGQQFVEKTERAYTRTHCQCSRQYVHGGLDCNFSHKGSVFQMYILELFLSMRQQCFHACLYRRANIVIATEKTPFVYNILTYFSYLIHLSKHVYPACH